MAHIQGMGKRLDKAIKRSGFNVKSLSKATGMTEAGIYKILNHENGCTALTVARLCSVLRISADWLLGLKGGD